jgi:hypothetical protein
MIFERNSMEAIKVPIRLGMFKTGNTCCFGVTARQTLDGDPVEGATGTFIWAKKAFGGIGAKVEMLPAPKVNALRSVDDFAIGTGRGSFESERPAVGRGTGIPDGFSPARAATSFAGLLMLTLLGAIDATVA